MRIPKPQILTLNKNTTMFGNVIYADRIARCFYDIDINLRRRFVSRRGIHNENAYTVILSEQINNAIESYFPIFVYSEQIETSIERLLGCDCIVIFRCGNEVKICLFEAKWGKNNWDYRQNNTSHFTSQLVRQCEFKETFAIWEMFYDSNPYTSSLILGNNASSCSWHEDVHNFQRRYVIDRIWNNPDLSALLAMYGRNIYQIVFSIIMCSQGKKLVVEGNFINPKFPKNNFKIPIPLDIDGDISKNNEIKDFVKKFNLGLYAYIDLSNK